MRKPRETQNGGRYHVCSRANRQEMIFYNSEIRELFLTTLHRAQIKYSFQIENFCVLGNHFHIILKTKAGTDLSRIMQWVLSVFAMHWNRDHKTHGHVWGDRFFSTLIKSRDAFKKISQYIDENPIKAQLAKKIGDWPFCGLWHFKHKVYLLLNKNFKPHELYSPNWQTM